MAPLNPAAPGTQGRSGRRQTVSAARRADQALYRPPTGKFSSAGHAPTGQTAAAPCVVKPSSLNPKPKAVQQQKPRAGSAEKDEPPASRHVAAGPAPDRGQDRGAAEANEMLGGARSWRLPPESMGPPPAGTALPSEDREGGATESLSGPIVGPAPSPDPEEWSRTAAKARPLAAEAGPPAERSGAGEGGKSAGRPLPAGEGKTCPPAPAGGPPQEFAEWLEGRLEAEGLEPIVAAYVEGLLEALPSIQEQRSEHEEALLEFLQAMLVFAREHAPSAPCSAEELAREIWDRWQREGPRTPPPVTQAAAPHPALLGADSATPPGGGEAVDRFASWLDRKLGVLGLEAEAFAPFVRGLLAGDQGAALAIFLEEVAASTGNSQGQDPAVSATEITLRWEQWAATGQIDLPPLTDGLLEGTARGGATSAPPHPPPEPKRAARRGGRLQLPPELFAHWFDAPTGTRAAGREGPMESGAPWADDPDPSGRHSDDSDGDLCYHCHSMEGSCCSCSEDFRVSGNAPRIRARGRPIRVSPEVDRLGLAMPALRKGGGGGELFGAAGGARHVAPPRGATSSAVARRMILHVLGVKDPRRKI